MLVNPNYGDTWLLHRNAVAEKSNNQRRASNFLHPTLRAPAHTFLVYVPRSSKRFIFRSSASKGSF